MSVYGNYGTVFDFYHDGSTNTAGSLRETINLTDSPVKSLVAGTGSGQCDLIWSRSKTAAAAPDNWDLTNLTDAFGVTINFAHVKQILIKNLSATDTLTVGNGTNPFAGWLSSGSTTEIVGPGGIMFKSDPVTGRATSGSSKVLKIDPGAASIAYQIVVVGTSV